MKNEVAGFLFYIDEQGSKKVFHYQTYKNLPTRNSYTTPYIRFIGRGFNYILGRFDYWYKKNNNTPQSSITLTTKAMVKGIKCSRAQANNIFKYINDIFELGYDRDSRARKISLNEQFIEFLTVYTEEQYIEYCEKYGIRGENEYRLRQMFNYRIFTQHIDSQRDNKQLKMDRKEFMMDPFIKNYHHFVYTNNKSDGQRLNMIENNIEYLSLLEKDQLKKIKKEMKPGELLRYYLHKVLIKLEQKVSGIASKLKREAKPEEHNITSSIVNRNKTIGEQRKTHDVGQVCKKDPEDVTLQDIVRVAALWNIISNGRIMDKIKNLSEGKIQSIDKLMKVHGKDNVLIAVKNISNMYHDKDKCISLIQFKDFVQDKRFNVVLDFNTEDTRLKNTDAYNTIMENRSKFFITSNKINYDNVPNFTSDIEAKNWFQSNVAYM